MLNYIISFLFRKSVRHDDPIIIVADVSLLKLIIREPVLEELREDSLNVHMILVETNNLEQYVRMIFSSVLDPAFSVHIRHIQPIL